MLPPVFKKWIKDDIERENKAYYIDTTPFKEKGKESRDNFEPERFMKDTVDLQLCEERLKNNFKYFQIFFQECIAKSPTYPEIDMATFTDHITQVLVHLNNNVEAEHQFNMKQVELEVQFISATRNDDKSGRSLCRGEMLELMVRISHMKYRQMKIRHRRTNNRRTPNKSASPLKNSKKSLS